MLQLLISGEKGKVLTVEELPSGLTSFFRASDKNLNGINGVFDDYQRTMKTYIKNLLKRTNRRLHKRLLDRLRDPEYRADLFVSDILGQLVARMEEEGISKSDLARKLDVDRSAVTQFFGSDSSVSVKTLFKYADAVGLTLEHPGVDVLDVDVLYAEYEGEAKGEESIEFEV